MGPWDNKENRTSLLQKVRDDYDLGGKPFEPWLKIIAEKVEIAQSGSGELEESAVQSACEDLWDKVEEAAKPLLKALREIAS